VAEGCPGAFQDTFVVVGRQGHGIERSCEAPPVKPAPFRMACEVARAERL